MSFKIIETCTGCSACEKRCPTAAIHGIKKEMYYIDNNLCIDCGACGAVCPDEAILDTYDRLCDQLKSAQRPKAYVELDKCTGCVYCVHSCPFDCITMDPAPKVLAGDGIAARVAVVETKKCTGCTVCEIDCPYDAIHIFRQDDPRAKKIQERSGSYWSSDWPAPGRAA